MRRQNKIIFLSILLISTLLDSQEIKYSDNLTKNDSFSPHIADNLYQGPYERILSLAEIKRRILKISSKPYLIQKNGKFYKFTLNEREYFVWINAENDSISIKLKKSIDYFLLILSISKFQARTSNWYISYHKETDIISKDIDLKCRLFIGIGEREASERYGLMSDIPYNSVTYQWKCEDSTNSLLNYKFEVVKDGREVFTYNDENKLIPITTKDQTESWLYNPEKIDSKFNFQTCLYEYLYNGKIDHQLCKKFVETNKK